MIRSIRALSALGVIILAGCGGGSSGSSSSSSSASSSTPVAVHMQAAMQQYVQAGVTSSFSVTGWVIQNNQQYNVSGSGQVTISPQQSNGSFNETISGNINGSSYSETLALSIPYSSAPVSVTAGDSGTIGNATYSVAANGADSLLVTITAASTSGATTNQLQSVYQINTAGVVTPVSAQDQATVSGTEVLDLTLTF